jgi:5,10-methylene-tetrahydrofolate dehydrogenase/methenyl tetrahydrofolate cyclohydrolase
VLTIGRGSSIVPVAAWTPLRQHWFRRIRYPYKALPSFSILFEPFVAVVAYPVHRVSSLPLLSATMSNDVKSKIIDGKQIAAQLREEIRLAVLDRMACQKMVPGLAVILVGSRRDSQTYVNMKKKACKEAGIISTGYDFAETVTEQELLDTIQELNASPEVHGILIQLPLPVHLNQDVILRAVDPRKDVDGLHPINTAALQIYSDGNAMDAPFSIPCTPLGCLELLDRIGVELCGKHCVVLGRSYLVGLPMSRLLLGRDATVTICHSKTINPASIVSQGDVVVVAIGRPELVTADWIKPDAVVIDVGINSVDVTDDPKKTYRLVGDVKFDDVLPKCSKITPVPGGVGPMTIAMLLRNTLRSCERMSKPV